MQVRALKSFKGKYGPIRTGQTFNPDPDYARKAVRNGLVEIIEATEPGPSKDRNKGDAPGRAGKGGAPEPSAPSKQDQSGSHRPENPTAPQPPAAGQVLTSSSLQADRASPPLTLNPSAPGARRGTPTPRQKAKDKGKKKPSSTPPAAGAGE